VQAILPWKSLLAMRTDTHASDLMNGLFPAMAPLHPAPQKVIVEEQRLQAPLPAQGDGAWKAPAENHSQRVC